MPSDADIVGYRVLGRVGELGRIVGFDGMNHGGPDAMLVVRGGRSESLLFHLPLARLIGVSPETRTVATDVDVADFIPSFAHDETVELHLG